MAEYIIPTVPFDGGVFTNYPQSGSICHLGNGRFVTVVAQNNPDAVIAIVTDIADPKTANIQGTTVRRQILREFAGATAFAYIGAWRLNATTILVGIQFLTSLACTLNAYSVNPVTGELIKINVNVLNPTNFVNEVVNSGCAFELKDNVVLVARVGVTVAIGRVDFNTANNTLVYTQMDSYSGSNLNVRSSFSRRPGTTDEAVLSMSHIAGTDTSILLNAQVARLYMLTPTTFSMTVPPVSLNPALLRHRVMGMLTSTKGYATDGSYYCEYDLPSNTFNAKISLFSGALDAGSAHAAIDVVPINENYFGIVSVTPISNLPETSLTNATYHLRIVKYTDYNLAQCTPGTANNTKGIVLPASYSWYAGKPAMSMWGPDVFYTTCRKSINEWAIRTVWA